MDKELKDKLFDYAIERINQYDKVLDKKNVGLSWGAMPGCKGCQNVDTDCDICPFSLKHKHKSDEQGCRPVGQIYLSPKEHQSDLIKAVNIWCKNFYPEYKMVRK